MTDHKKPIIAFNAIHAKSGGGLTYVKNITKNLSDLKRYEIHLFIHENQQEIFSGIDDDIVVHAFNFKEGLIRTILWEQGPLVLALRALHPDIVLSTANYGPIFAPNHILVLQNSLAVGKYETRLSKKLYWYCLGIMTNVSFLAASSVIAVSKYVVGTLHGFCLRQSHKITIIHHGVSDVFSPDPAVQEDFALMVGDVYVQKNYHTLLKALSIIKKDHEDIKVKIAGVAIDEDYKRKIDAIIYDNDISDNVQFLGRCDIDQIASLYKCCKVFIFPSIEESFGMPVAEAMASGCAIACSNAAAMPEIAEDAVLYFQPDDEADIARVVSRLWDDGDLRADLSARALDRARHFRWKNAAQALAAVFDRLIAARQSRRV